MQRQPHDDEDEEPNAHASRAQLPSPQELSKRPADIANFLKDVSIKLNSLKKAQLEHAHALGDIAKLLNQAELHDAPWAAPAAQLMLRWEEQSSQVLANAGAAMQIRPFADFEVRNVRAVTLRASNYEQAHEAHTEAKRKVDGKPEKRRLPVLQQAEREAFRKGTSAHKAVRDQLQLLEEDLEKVMLNATRDLVHSQLALNAQGLEHFTRVMQALPAVREGA